jgi:hypothetical protein
MLNTYIKNRGTTKTIIHNNNHNEISSINWDADYDGDIAHIALQSNTNGKRERFDISLDNDDLANILNVQSVDIPIDKRLQMDFQESYADEPYILELPTPELVPRKPKNVRNVISSPLPNEELIIPLEIDQDTTDKYTFTPKKKHRRRKTHVTHKVYKKIKSSRKSKSKTRSKSRRTMSTPIIDLINRI